MGIDYSDELLQQARAASQDLPFHYVKTDVNEARFPPEAFDVVINHAASHHIARLDRVFRELCRRLPPSGWMVSFDYVGPHRNQWSGDVWEAAELLNRSLPPELRQDLRYPHLPTMLRTDPTEAVHSELVLSTFRRYFDAAEIKPVGGALAYLLLTHNERLFGVADQSVRDEQVERILQADRTFLSEHPKSALFAYFSGRPRKSVLEQQLQLGAWTLEEDRLEEHAAAHEGEYYPRTPLQTKYLLLEARANSRHPVKVIARKLAHRAGQSPSGRRFRRSYLGRVFESWMRRLLS